MAERIGFINFTAFELRRANEFDAIKTRLYHADRPARSYFDIHPSLPPWRQLSLLGVEPMVRKTPAELRPLMNEYYRYFADKAMQHEFYQRWWKRHHAWYRDSEIFFNRFDDLRDHLNEVYNREAYISMGRNNLIFRHAAAKSWANSEAATQVRLQHHEQSASLNERLLSMKTQHRRYIHQAADPFHPMEERKVALKAHDRAQATGEHYTREALHPPHAEPPRWAKLLAVADYAQKHQMPLPQVALESRPEAVKPQSIPAASVLKGSKI